MREKAYQYFRNAVVSIRKINERNLNFNIIVGFISNIVSAYSIGMRILLFYRNADIVSAAIGFDGVFGYAEIVGNSGIALGFATQEFNPLFLC